MTPENERVCDPSERSSVKTGALVEQLRRLRERAVEVDEFALESLHGESASTSSKAEDAVLLALDREAGGAR